MTIRMYLIIKFTNGNIIFGLMGVHDKHWKRTYNYHTRNKKHVVTTIILYKYCLIIIMKGGGIYASEDAMDGYYVIRVNKV